MDSPKAAAPESEAGSGSLTPTQKEDDVEVKVVEVPESVPETAVHQTPAPPTPQDAPGGTADEPGAGSTELDVSAEEAAKNRKVGSCFSLSFTSALGYSFIAE